MNIGLFFGSFNPLHLGHKLIASYIVDSTYLDKVCFVVSPQNPLKIKKSLLDEHHRLQIIKAEIEDNNKLEVSDIEFSMPIPSYTIDTLVRIKEQHPKNNYILIMGSDNLNNFHKWKNYEKIIQDYEIFVYKRPGNQKVKHYSNVTILEGVPHIEISSSLIRKSIKAGKDVSYFMPEKAWKYMEEMNFYK